MMARTHVMLMAALLGACSGSQAPAEPTTTPTLRPRRQASASTTPGAITTAGPLGTPGPTATPFTHTVQDGETLLGIALDYGVDLADLLLANPGINPRFLSIGTELTVPISGALGPIPSATPFPLVLSNVNCFADISGAHSCVLTASLAGTVPVEGVIALVTLLASDGTALRTEPAYSPLNLLEAESRLPLVAYFDPPVPQFVLARAVTVSALQAGQVEGRYSPLQITLESTEFGPDRRTVVLAGSVRLTSSGSIPDNEARIVAMLLDENDELIGLRVLESLQVDALRDGLAFEIELRSLGPEIAQVMLLAEAR